MKKLLKTISSISLITLLLLACNKNECSDSVKGELKDLSGLDGCGFVIELGNGNKLEPLNLSDFDFDLIDGNKVWISYHLTTNMIGTTCMVGDIIEIDCIANR
ncbi:MAG: hypothetical protein P8O07_07155 [Crocinitomicaceae bacterium]|nr:hypothetical protein [Crocinitomicaceae bacterium]